MHKTVGEHIKDLEQKLLALNAQIMEETDLQRRNNLEAELRAAESALTLYRSAFEIESRLSRT